VRALVAAGRLRIRVGDDTVEIARGRVASVNGLCLAAAPDDHPDEPRLVAAWLSRNRASIRIASCDGEFAQPIGGGRALTEWHERLRRLRIAEATR
jgi:gamma-glutamyl:cysteine ligase YbdK (ATP-grasp superfamily)